LPSSIALIGTAKIPSGDSSGKREAIDLRDLDKDHPHRTALCHTTIGESSCMISVLLAQKKPRL
jgi:hypothetical protein